LVRLTRAPWRSAWVAGLFSWHPLHVESVAWVAERKDLLSACFCLLTFLAYASYVGESTNPGPHSRTKSRMFYVLALFLFALALLSKPMAVTLPFVLLLLDYWPLNRAEISGGTGTQQFLSLPWKRMLLEKTPFLILSAISCALTLWAQEAGHSILSTDQLPLADRISHVAVSYLGYIGKAIFPRQLAVYYPYATAPLWESVGSGVLILASSCLILILARRRPYLLVGWLWFLGTLVPVIGLVQAGDQAMADRYSYLPLIGLFLMFVWAVAESGAMHTGLKRTLACFTLALAIGCTIIQLRYWQDTRALFDHAARVTGKNQVAAAILGSMLAKEGKLEEARQLYLQALAFKPDYPEAHFFLGYALDQQGKTDEAIARYKLSLRIRPFFSQAHIFLAMALVKEHAYDEALFHYTTALMLDPDSPQAHHNLAKLFQIQGRLDEAMENYATALRLDATLAPAHNNLGVILLQKGKAADGEIQLKEALRLDPNNLETKYNLIPALMEEKHWDDAIALCSELARVKPDDSNLHFQWGMALARRQRTKEAMGHYAKALLIRPDFPEALSSLAWILATDPSPEFRNGPEAVPMAERACELSGRRNPLILQTLAAAYAEAGRFDEAVATVQTAREIALAAGQQEKAAKCQNLLDRFKSRQPLRETP
jgi:protein O-mannosyl-transferase